MGRERGPDFYDKKSERALEPRAIEMYKDLYRCAANFLSRAPKHNMVLDLGCGVGRLARILYKEGFKDYVGVDFSTGMITKAKEQVPKFKFIIANMLSSEVNDLCKGCRTFVLLEVLEHITKDIEVLRMIPQGSLVVISLPSYSAKGHVRYFKSSKKVKLRYESVLDFDKGESKLVLNKKGSKIFVFSAYKKLESN